MTMTQRSLGVVAFGLVLAVGLGLTGCSGTPTAESTPKSAIEQFAELPGVVEVSPHNESVTVSVGSTSPDAEVLAAAASIETIAVEAGFSGAVTLQRQAGWRLDVYPVTEGTSDQLAQILLLEKIEPAATVVVIDGWPYVGVESMESFGEVFHVLAANSLFANGGTVSQGDEHLRIVWVSKRTSLHAIDEIIAIATEYPQAEVLLEATTAGPQWPTLYIARLSADEAATLQHRLLAPALADADVEGYGLPFILTSIGPDGPVYLDGNLGGVVEG